MNPALSRFLSTLLVDRQDGHRSCVLASFREKGRLNSASADEIGRHQRDRLALLLRHARTAVPFYRGRLPDPEGITADNAFELLDRLPAVGRTDLQREPEAFRAEGADASVPDATGGSTGTPMRFLVDRPTQIARESSLYWADSLLGWQPGERIAMLWGSDKDLRSAMAQGRTRLRYLVDNRRWYNSFDMGPDRMDAFHADLQQWRPHTIVAYAGSICLYARHLKARGRQPVYPLRGIVASAEVLTSAMRQEIESVFPCRVFDRYGNREFGAIAAEDGCHDGLVLNRADCLVEVGAGAGECGPVRVTYLHNFAMPFLRYDTGDVASLRADGRLSPVQGRSSDTMRTRDGRLIHGEYFTHLMYACPAVRQFQFIQKDLDTYVLKVAGSKADMAGYEAGWRKSLGEKLGEGICVTVEYVDRIAPLASGKHKFTLSLLAAEPAERGA